MALPLRTTGSLWPAFAPARLVGLAVKLPICVYALHTIANRVEGTFERLRYNLGGDRPSQTTHQTMSRRRIHGCRLELQHHKGGISRLAPRVLADPLQSLPPILHK